VGLGPTLAVTTKAGNAVGRDLATALVMACANGAVSPVRHYIPSEIRSPVFILVIASLVTMIDYSMNAFAHDLHKVLGIFIPLIVVNCIVLARVESFAAKNAPAPSILDGLMMGLGLTLVLGLLGTMRELIGKGTLLSDLDLVFGPAAQSLMWQSDNYQGLLLAILPPGAFLGLASLIAIRNWFEVKKAAKPKAKPPTAPAHVAQEA